MLADLSKAAADVLATVANHAFRLGLEDGAKATRQLNSHELVAKLPPHPMRQVHRLKLRQVYGAGYDIAEANARLEGKGAK